MRTLRICSLLLLALAVAVPAAWADIVLNDWTFYVDGSTFNPPALPGYFNTAGFDFAAGLGTITVSYNPGPGDHTVIAYFDHDIMGFNNIVNDETGTAQGSPGPNQVYEIDEPGYTTGDLVNNVLAGALDNNPAAGSAYGPDDIAMALGYAFALGADESATLTFRATTVAPATGFYLQQSDADGDEVFLSSSLDISGTTAVPEPSSIILLAAVAAVVGWTLRKKGLAA